MKNNIICEMDDTKDNSILYFCCDSDKVSFDIINTTNEEFIELFNFLSKFMENNYIEISKLEQKKIINLNIDTLKNISHINREIVKEFINILNEELENIRRFLIDENKE